MSMNTKQVVIPVPDPGGSDTLLIFKAPSANNGGGRRLLEASFVNHAATSGGNAFSLALHRFSNAGTPAVNGTIASAIGGTTALLHWGDSIPKAFTIDHDYSFLDAGEWLALVYTEIGTGNTTNGQLVLTFADGK